MKKRIWLIVLVAAAGCVMLLGSCCHPLGWWLGIPPPDLPRQVITNKLWIQKAELPSTLIPKIDVSKFPEYDYNPKMDRIYYPIFGTIVMWAKNKNVEFSGNNYHIGYTLRGEQGDEIIFVKRNQLKKIVKRLALPTGIISLDTFDVQFGAEKYLVVAGPTVRKRNGSLLFILDKELNTVYEEHAPYAFEIGTYNDERHGECVIVKYGDPYDEDRAKYYMYYLPGKDRPVDEPVR